MTFELTPSVKGLKPMFSYIENSLIRVPNQLAGFYMIKTPVLTGFKKATIKQAQTCCLVKPSKLVPFTSTNRSPEIDWETQQSSKLVFINIFDIANNTTLTFAELVSTETFNSTFKHAKIFTKLKLLLWDH